MTSISTSSRGRILVFRANEPKGMKSPVKHGNSGKSFAILTSCSCRYTRLCRAFFALSRFRSTRFCRNVSNARAAVTDALLKVQSVEYAIWKSHYQLLTGNGARPAGKVYCLGKTSLGPDLLGSKVPQMDYQYICTIVSCVDWGSKREANWLCFSQWKKGRKSDIMRP